MSLEEINNALHALERNIPSYEAYEYTLQREQCEFVGQILGNLLAHLPQVSDPTASDGVAALTSLRKMGIEVRMTNAAYIPHCQSQALTYLKKRRRLAEALNALIVEAKRVITLLSAEVPSSASVPLSDHIDSGREHKRNADHPSVTSSQPIPAIQPVEKSHSSSSPVDPNSMPSEKGPKQMASSTIHCSVCCRPKCQVKWFINSGNIYLCEGCVELCNDLLREDGITTDAPTPEQKHSFRRSQYCCSFCGKEYHEVARLIAMKNPLYICNECVGACNKIIAEAVRTQNEGSKESASSQVRSATMEVWDSARAES